MKIAVLADIHGNYKALEVCLDYAKRQGVEQFFFLGDYIGELAYPEKTMDMLYDLQQNYKCIFVKGNKEDYWLGNWKDFEKSWVYGNSTTGTFLYQYERLRERDLDFFRSMPIARSVEFEGLPSIMLCHGSPDSVKYEIRELNDEVTELLINCKENTILCGHTHRRLCLEKAGKHILNPGSVGIPLASMAKSQFMLLHEENGGWTPEFVDLEYDVETVIEELQESGLCHYAPYWCKSTELLLRTGKISNGQMLKRVMKLCEQEEGKCNWPFIPEKYWQKVVEQAYEEVLGRT